MVIFVNIGIIIVCKFHLFIILYHTIFLLFLIRPSAICLSTKNAENNVAVFRFRSLAPIHRRTRTWCRKLWSTCSDGDRGLPTCLIRGRANIISIHYTSHVIQTHLHNITCSLHTSIGSCPKSFSSPGEKLQNLKVWGQARTGKCN